jgi:hypothetical protein
MSATRRGATKPLRSQEAKQWTLPGFPEPFIQDPLTFFERNELLGLVAGALDEVVREAGDVAGLLSAMDLDEVSVARLRRGQITAESLQAANLIGLLTRIVRHAPRLLEDVYLLALSVPPEGRDAARDALRQIDDDTGFGIFETFVEQNAETLQSFAVRWWNQLSRAIQRTGDPAADDSSPTSNG